MKRKPKPSKRDDGIPYCFLYPYFFFYYLGKRYLFVDHAGDK